MKSATTIVFSSLLCLQTSIGYSQQNKPNAFDKANNAINKVSSAIAVFQPYLLKARQLFYDGKQLATDVKNAANSNFGKNGGNNGNYGSRDTSSYPNNYNSNTGNTGTNGNYNSGSSGYNSSNASNNNGNNYSNTGYNQNASSNGNNGSYPQNYLTGQSLPISNPAVVNNDGTGNWGNQNNGLYGNCLDAMTGNVLGMGEAAQTPTSVDIMFFAPADGQNAYTIMTPGFARNNSTAGYMTEHVSEQVLKWTDVNETEIALTKLTIGQFNQIQNNNQIQNAVRNAQDYAGYYTSLQKLDGQVLAVKIQMDNREVYALIAVLKQYGTSGSNGYLKIQIKTTGLATANGQINTGAYLR